MKNVIFVIISIVSIHAHADDWICKSQSVVKQGPSNILACGIGEAKTEQDARDAAREDAVTEFRKVCQTSADCREFDYNVEPKRLDCQSKGNSVVCYQAIQFEILDVKRKDVLLDLPDVEKQLALKKREVAIQEAKINRLQELKTQSELSEKNEEKLAILEKNVSKAEGEKIKLEEQSEPSNGYVYTYQLFNNSIKVSTSYWSTDFFKKGELNEFIDIGYEYRPTKHLGLGITYRFGTDITSVGKTQQNIGTPNTQSVQEGSTQIKDLSVHTNVYIAKGFYLKGELGHAQAVKNQYSVSYGSLGTAVNSSSSQVSVSKTYVGASIGYDSRNHERGLGFFSELGARESLGDGKTSVISVVGLNFGF